MTVGYLDYFVDPSPFELHGGSFVASSAHWLGIDVDESELHGLKQYATVWRPELPLRRNGAFSEW